MEDSIAMWNSKKQSLGIAADHAGFALKQYLLLRLQEDGYEVKDFGNSSYKDDDNFPEYVLPLARSVSKGEIDKAIAICGSGVGASIAANKIENVRACLIHETFSARQGVEDDDMNMICLGGRVIGHLYAWELVSVFLSATFIKLERHVKRLEEISEAEKSLIQNQLKREV